MDHDISHRDIGHIDEAILPDRDARKISIGIYHRRRSPVGRAVVRANYRGNRARREVAPDRIDLILRASARIEAISADVLLIWKASAHTASGTTHRISAKSEDWPVVSRNIGPVSPTRRTRATGRIVDSREIEIAALSEGQRDVTAIGERQPAREGEGAPAVVGGGEAPPRRDDHV